VSALVRVKRHDERGVSMVLFALLMVTFTVFVAFAVDIGGVANQRRRAQLSDDAGVLGAAQDLPFTSSARAQVVSLVNQDLGVSWTAGGEWNTCGSVSAPSGYTKDSTSNCIAYDSSFSRVWAAVPVAGYNTAFGGVVGLNSINVSAQAIAGRALAGAGGVLPFALLGGIGGGLNCIKSDSGGNASAPCGGPSSGNFGNLDIFFYGNASLGTTTDCNGNGGNTRTPNNIALGIDHELSTWSAGNDREEACSPNVSAPNIVHVRTGDIANAFDEGILSGGSFTDGSTAGRLVRKYDSTTNYYNDTATVSGRSINDAGLWEFIPQGVTIAQAPTSCQRATFDTVYANSNNSNRKDNMRLALLACFADYANGTGCSSAPCAGALFIRNSQVESPVDVYDIQLTPRFAYVPQIVETSFPNGNSSPVHIQKFRAIYVQRLLGNSIDHEPGVGDSGGNQKAKEVNAFVFYTTMLPGNLGDAPYAVGQNMFIQLIK
jgi:hypothetical protein